MTLACYLAEGIMKTPQLLFGMSLVVLAGCLAPTEEDATASADNAQRKRPSDFCKRALKATSLKNPKLLYTCTAPTLDGESAAESFKAVYLNGEACVIGGTGAGGVKSAVGYSFPKAFDESKRQRRLFG
jgi:hypothetical protein